MHVYEQMCLLILWGADVLRHYLDFNLPFHEDVKEGWRGGGLYEFHVINLYHWLWHNISAEEDIWGYTNLLLWQQEIIFVTHDYHSEYWTYFYWAQILANYRQINKACITYSLNYECYHNHANLKSQNGTIVSLLWIFN